MPGIVLPFFSYSSKRSYFEKTEGVSSGPDCNGSHGSVLSFDKLTST